MPDSPGSHNYGPTMYQYINGNKTPGNSTPTYGPTQYDYIHGNINNLQSFYPSPVWGVTMDQYIAGQR